MMLQIYAIVAGGLMLAGLLAAGMGLIGAYLSECDDAQSAGYIGFGAAVFLLGVSMNP